MTDEQLLQAQLALKLACARSHSTARKKKQQWYCFTFRALDLEAQERGLESVTAPYHAGDLGPGPSAL